MLNKINLIEDIILTLRKIRETKKIEELEALVLKLEKQVANLKCCGNCSKHEKLHCFKKIETVKPSGFCSQWKYDGSIPFYRIEDEERPEDGYNRSHR